jgi:hypothetical protein
LSGPLGCWWRPGRRHHHQKVVRHHPWMTR